MNLTGRFIYYIQKEALFTKGDRLLLAVSGGIDSVSLCELCKQAGYEFAMAHCNFGLRAEESTRDESFVKQLAHKYQVEFFLKRFNTSDYAASQKVSIQVAARQLRYAWFNELLADATNRFRFLLTAHHADDNLETVLMNMFKGTGIAGLRGILPKQEKLVRPLLIFHKEELQQFVKEQQLEYVEDSSNQLDKYTRNFFRNSLIPSIEKVFPAVKSNLLDNIKRFSEIELLYTQAIEAQKKKLVEKKGVEVHIPILKLKQTVPLETVFYEIIRDYGFSPKQVPEGLALLESESGKFVAGNGYRIIRNRNWLIIAPVADSQTTLLVIEENTHSMEFPLGRIQFKKLAAAAQQIPVSNDYASVDARSVAFPLILRKWKQGDYFYPLGMKKKKKLSRFLSNQKCSLTEKEHTWVLESNKKIIWVVGKRIDDRFKRIPSTTEVLEIKYSANG